ncbi:MAG: helix-turn-helix domain-containing protein [Rhodococcus sp.]|nr:helix-turn-helix domain-containing protein [Rhodococcus sp. (in: high G+C Gram-positive bacteria)]
MAVAAEDYRRAELARFLRSCRERISPVEAGLLDRMPPRRRLRGLRREEVAQLAGIGVCWYTWLEQGRTVSLAVDVATALANAFRLSADEASYLYSLGGLAQSPVDGIADDNDDASSDPVQDLQLVVDGFGAHPAYAIDRYWNVLCTNNSARCELGIETGKSCLVRLFTEPGRESWYGDPQRAAELMVARFRQHIARYPDEPQLQDTVARLLQEPPFVSVWQRHEVITSLSDVISYRAGGTQAPREYRIMGLAVEAHPTTTLVLNIPV